jgi:hypothetical protein
LTALPQDEVTIGRLLRGAGYEAVALGKAYRPQIVSWTGLVSG